MEKLTATCPYCATKVKDHLSSIKSHLKKCNGIKENAKKMGTDQYHILRAKSNYAPQWLILKAHKNILLEELDDLLRDGWLECCGHMSAFSVPSKGSFHRNTLNKYASVENAFSAHSSMDYEYDFGSTTELVIEHIEERELPNDGNLVVLLQNDAPEIPCHLCGERIATEMCEDCMYEGEGDDFLYCSDCNQNHGHLPESDYSDVPLPFVNSPRAGTCAYTGPVDFSHFAPAKKKVKPAKKSKEEEDELYSEDDDDFLGMPPGFANIFAVEDEDEDEDEDEMKMMAEMMQHPQILSQLQDILMQQTGGIPMLLPNLLFQTFNHYQKVAEAAINKLSDEQFFKTPNAHTHSVAALVKHIYIHLHNNWTDVEKIDNPQIISPQKQFEAAQDSRKGLMKLWKAGWEQLYKYLDTNEGIQTFVQQEIMYKNNLTTVWIRVVISLAHYGYHIGQIVQTSKWLSDNWEKKVFPLSIISNEEEGGAKEISLFDK